MKARRKIAGQNWEFDGSTLTVRIPITWKRRGGRKVIIAPDGGDAWAPAKPDGALIRALARAHRWQRMLEEGKYRSAAEIGDAEGTPAVLHHGYETSGCIVHAAKSMTLCWSALT